MVVLVFILFKKHKITNCSGYDKSFLFAPYAAMEMKVRFLSSKTFTRYLISKYFIIFFFIVEGILRKCKYSWICMKKTIKDVTAQQDNSS